MMHGSLPAKLRLLRARQGLTLIEAAERIGIGRDTLSSIERGHQHPTFPTLKRLAEGYDVPVDDLLDDALDEAEALGKAQASSESEGLAGKPLAGLYGAARRGIEGFCEKWEERLAAGDLERGELEELRGTIELYNPVIDTLVSAELRELATMLHRREGSGEEPVYGPVELRRKFSRNASLTDAVDWYLGVCLAAMRARARKVGADPAEDADVISLEEHRKALHIGGTGATEAG
jgi:transcriptional regulator with XRE-family HTH domain